MPGAALSNTQRTESSEELSIHIVRLKVGPANTFGPYQLGQGARQEDSSPSFCRSGNSGKSDSRWGLGREHRLAAEGKEPTGLWMPAGLQDSPVRLPNPSIWGC